jgi:acyl carrier protein
VPDPLDAIVDSLRSQIALQSRGRLRADEVDADAHVCEQGYLDSLSYVEFLLHVERTWGVRVGDAQFVGRFHTLRALADHIDACRSGAAA